MHCIESYHFSLKMSLKQIGYFAILSVTYTNKQERHTEIEDSHGMTGHQNISVQESAGNELN